MSLGRRTSSTARSARARCLPTLVVLGIVLAALLTACGIEDDTSPREISEANRADVVSPTSRPTSPSAGTDRV